jgi:hypothetical protein
MIIQYIVRTQKFCFTVQLSSQRRTILNHFIIRLFSFLSAFHLIGQPFYFIVRLLLYCPPFYFLGQPFAQLMSNICLFFLVSGIFYYSPRAYSPCTRDFTDFTALVLRTRSVKSIKSNELGLYLHSVSKNPHNRSVKNLVQ